MSLETQISELTGELKEMKDVLNRIATAIAAGSGGQTDQPERDEAPAKKPSRKKRETKPAEPVSDDTDTPAGADKNAEQDDAGDDVPSDVPNELSTDDVRAKLKLLKDRGGDPRKLLLHLGAKTLSDLSNDKYSEAFSLAAGWLSRNTDEKAA